MTHASSLIRRKTVFWTRRDRRGLECCTLAVSPTGIAFEGTVLLEQPALEVAYTIECDVEWRTQRVAAWLRTPTRDEQLLATVDAQGRWWNGERELEQARGCRDVDLSVTPSTNTLPIRRLELEIGASATVTAAWIRFPQLRIEPLSQRYTRLARDHYRYESPSFTAELRVDEFNLVESYGDIWQRCAEQA